MSKATDDFRRASAQESAIAEAKKELVRSVRKGGNPTEWERDPVLHLPQPQSVDKSFHLLAEALPQIIWTAEPDGTVDYMNSRWFEYTGLTAKETYTESRTAVHPDDVEEYRRRWKQAVESEQPYEMEYRFRRASDGIYRWFLGRGVPVRDEQGSVLKWFGTCTDIHDQKQAEEEVRKLNAELERKVRERTTDLEHEMRERMEAEERVRSNLELMKTMIDTMPMAAVAADRHHQILHCNEQFQLLFAEDKDPKSLPGTDCIAVLSASEDKFSSPEHFESILLSILRNTRDPLKNELVTKEGRTYSFDYLPITEGNFHRGYLLLYRDISSEKRINRAKTEFMSLASHQLRTPLTAVRWALSRLSKKLVTRLQPSEEILLDRARTSIEGMASTITTMLSISRIEAGMLSPHVASVSLRYFLQDVCNAFRDECELRNQKLEFACPDDLIIDTDAKILRESVENLLSNAVKYTPSNGTVFLQAERVQEHVKIVVCDTGYGIPKRQHHKIFTKFFRADNVVQIDTEGTGLGLYLVSQLVHLLKGEITFSSEEGKGSEFSILLPGDHK